MSIDISKHPLIKQAYEVCQAIEKCGASTELTDAVTKASALMQEIANAMARPGELEAAERRIAELEAREVNLPPNELVTDTWTAPGDGWEVFDAQKVIDSIRSAGVRIAAGITVKGE
ncbi:TPA: hypothetical protein ACPEVZ_002003 [Citrobacter freundii]